MLVLDFDRQVTEVQTQPFTIRYAEGGQSRRYTPDILVRRHTDHGRSRAPQTMVYEVKQHADLRGHWGQYQARFRAANHYCRERGWTFIIVTEQRIRTPRLENARFLRPFRNIPDHSRYRVQLLRTLAALERSSVQELLEASFWEPMTRLEALPMLWKLVANGEITAAMDQRITMTTPIFPVV